MSLRPGFRLIQHISIEAPLWARNSEGVQGCTQYYTHLKEAIKLDSETWVKFGQSETLGKVG